MARTLAASRRNIFGSLRKRERENRGLKSPRAPALEVLVPGTNFERFSNDTFRIVFVLDIDEIAFLFELEKGTIETERDRATTSEPNYRARRSKLGTDGCGINVLLRFSRRLV